MRGAWKTNYMPKRKRVMRGYGCRNNCVAASAAAYARGANLLLMDWKMAPGIDCGITMARAAGVVENKIARTGARKWNIMRNVPVLINDKCAQ